MQLSIFFFLPSTDGAHLETLAGVGGLKWTRTIDLTLIRRVL